MSDTDAPQADPALVAEYVGRLKAIQYEAVGHVARLVISDAHDQHRTVLKVRIVPEVGVEGDHPWKQWWKGARQEGREVSAVNAEVLDALEVPYDVPGDNVIVRGFDLNALEKGDTIRMGDVVLIATGAAHRPCATFERRTSIEKKEAIFQERRRGTMLDALTDGHIRVGDPVERIFVGQQPPPQTPQ